MSKPARYVLLTVLFLSALFLSGEVWMQAVRHTSFCTTSSCAVVGEYIRFGEGNLIKLGAIFFWVLWILVFFGGRYNKNWIWGLVGLIMVGALAFDGALLGFQFVGLKEKCTLCVGVACALFLNLWLLAWVRRTLFIFLLGMSVWVGGFMANSALDLGVIAPALTDTAFLRIASEKNATTQYPQHVFFFSLGCDHCSKILANLAVNLEHVPTDTWLFSCVDNKEEDLQRLAHIQASGAAQENPFLEILRVEIEDNIAPLPIPDSLRRTMREARMYFKMKEFGGVPVLVVAEGPGRNLILHGEESIMRYLMEKEFVRRVIAFDTPPEPEETDSSQ